MLNMDNENIKFKIHIRDKTDQSEKLEVGYKDIKWWKNKIE